MGRAAISQHAALEMKARELKKAGYALPHTSPESTENSLEETVAKHLAQEKLEDEERLYTESRKADVRQARKQYTERRPSHRRTPRSSIHDKTDDAVPGMMSAIGRSVRRVVIRRPDVFSRASGLRGIEPEQEAIDVAQFDPPEEIMSNKKVGEFEESVTAGLDAFVDVEAKEPATQESAAKSDGEHVAKTTTVKPEIEKERQQNMSSKPVSITKADEEQAKVQAELEALDGPAKIKKLARKSLGRVHILGMNELGKLAAHALASIPGRPAITLLMRTKQLMQQWREEGEMMVMVKDRQAGAAIGFNVEDMKMTKAEHAQGRPLSNAKGVTGKVDSGWIIDKLVVTLPGFNTAKALHLIRDRLTSTSTIVFLHNSMGVIEKLNTEVFKNPATRPQYVLAFSKHGLANHPTRAFATNHYREGEILLAALPPARTLTEEEKSLGDWATWQFAQTKNSSSCNELLYMFKKANALNAKLLQERQLLFHKLEFLAVEACLGPLSVAYDCQIKDLRWNYMVSQNVMELLREICLVVTKMPELAGHHGVPKVFNVQNLAKKTAVVAEKLEDHMHPMWQRVDKGEQTDVQFINGYFVMKGKSLGVSCKVNLSLTRMVKAKQAMKQREAEGHIPWERGPKNHAAARKSYGDGRL